MSPHTIYADRLVEITDEGICFRLYYFPFGSKTVPFSDIECIRASKATLATGKRRIWGTGDFVTWFPCDVRRPSRDTIFHVMLKGQENWIGFTVEDSKTVTEILRSRGVLR